MTATVDALTSLRGGDGEDDSSVSLSKIRKGAREGVRDDRRSTSPSSPQVARDLAVEEYLGRGWAVVPVEPGTKKPHVYWNEAEAIPVTPSAAQVYAWFRKWPDADVGILTGRRSQGLLVVDIDPRNGGVRPMDLPSTLTATTPKGGEHLFLSVPVSAMGKGFKTGPHPELPGIDIKCEGGLVVAAPSQGREWSHVLPMMALPNRWLTQQRAKTSSRERPIVPFGMDPFDFGGRLLGDFAADVAGAMEGERNVMLYCRTKDAVRACHISAGLDLQVIADEMEDAAMRSGLNEREDGISRTIRSAIESVVREYA